jgi:HEAT repeat protein
MIRLEADIRRNRKMYTENITQQLESAYEINLFALPQAVEIKTDDKIGRLLRNLSPNIPWGDRQNSAKKLGYMRSQEALPVLLDVLPTDPFWMVRCSMIQAVERIGDPAAIPTLRKVARSDLFKVVRSQAAKTIGILTERKEIKQVNPEYSSHPSDFNQGFINPRSVA